jgi:prevent-host-death family protein
MIEVSVRELKNHLTSYLRRSEQGEQFTVTRRGKPVATLSRASAEAESPSMQAIRRLVAKGIVSWSGKKFIPPDKRVKMQGDGPTIAEMILEDRGDPLP